eukprot:3591840-Pleurochrysis_carterae.AAC.1
MADFLTKPMPPREFFPLRNQTIMNVQTFYSLDTHDIHHFGYEPECKAWLAQGSYLSHPRAKITSSRKAINVHDLIAQRKEFP